MSENPYSLELARRGLKHFAIGRILVGLVGVALLLLTVRRLDPSDLGSYMFLVAIQGIATMASSIGLFGFVERYIPEYRVRGSTRQLGVAISFAVAGRLSTLALACGLLFWAGTDLAAFFGLPVAIEIFRLYLLVILIEGTGRFIDLVFETLLMQWPTQVSNLLRTLVKLGGLLLIVGNRDWTLQDIVVWDAVASCAALVFAVSALCLGIRRLGRPRLRGEFDRTTMVRFAAYNYAALLGHQIYGVDTLKLLVTKLLGVLETAAYGLAYSLVDILRRYLPAQLLLGTIRPLVIASYLESRSMARPLFLANLVLKLNIFLIAPALAVAVALGGPLLELIGKGRYPEAYGYILALLLLLVAQTIHLMVAVLAATIERNDLVMRATWLAMAGAAVAVITIPIIGVWGAVAAAYVSEFGYCYVVARGLRAVCHQSAVCWKNLGRLAAIFIITAVSSWLASHLIPATNAFLTLSACLVVGCYFGIAFVWKPFSDLERELINRLLPKPLFVW